MPSGTKPVVVYGASGYTGRLICEYLREYHVPFLAVGRDAAKVKSVMESHVAGIETADYEVAEVVHDQAALTELFRGASVVCNTVGPFRALGATGRRGVPGRRDPLPRHDRRAGLAHHLRHHLRRRLRRRRAAARPRRRADVQHR